MSNTGLTEELAASFAAANLTANEASLIIALIHGDDEVEGFIDKSSPKVQGFNIGMPPGREFGFDTFEPDNATHWIDVLS